MIKKIILLLTLVTLNLSAANVVVDILNIENQLVELKKDKSFNKEILNGLIKEENLKIVELSKDIRLNHNKFIFLKSEYSQNLISQLKRKISINKEYENNEAILRDNIKIDYFDLIKHINYFVNILNKEYKKSGSDSNIIKILANELIYLEEINKKMVIYDNSIHADIDVKDGEVVKIKEEYSKAFDKYQNLFKVYKIYISYLNDNSTNVFSKNSFMSIFNFNYFIDYFNNLSSLKEVNNTLNNFGLIDIGKLIIFIIIMSIVLFVNLIVRMLILPGIKKKIEKKKDDSETADIIYENFKKIRKPISHILLLTGIDIGLQVLYYPSDIPLLIDSAIYLTYVIITAMFFVNITNISIAVMFQGNSKIKTNLREEIINLGNQIVKAIIVITALLLFLTKLGVEISGLVASLGIGGLAFALAAKDTISNFFGSMKIIFDESFSQGDWIKTDTAEGTVVEIGLISTKIRTFDNAMVTVPNGELANMTVMNWNRRQQGRRIKMYIGVSYEAKKEDLAKAIVEIREMLLKHLDISQPNDTGNDRSRKRSNGKVVNINEHYGVKKTLLVYLDTLNASSMDIMVYAFSKSTKWEDWLIVKQDVIFKIWDIIERNNLEFAFPTQTLYVREDNDFKTPEK